MFGADYIKGAVLVGFRVLLLGDLLVVGLLFGAALPHSYSLTTK